MPAEACTGVPADPGDPGSDPAAAEVAADPRVVVALVAVQLDRPRRGWPRPPRLIAGMVPRIGSTNRLSCRFAAETSTLSGSPSASTSRWYLLPALPRSVGFGPVSSPPFSPGR